MQARCLHFESDGAERYRGALSSSELATLANLFKRHAPLTAGRRLSGDPDLAALTAPGGSIHSIAARQLGTKVRAVRALLFDKTELSNWALGWHQDRTIVIQARHQIPGFEVWSRKGGLDHVEPPISILEEMVTLRAHLDPCGDDNAPLLVAPGSHRLGRIAVGAIEMIVASLGQAKCIADPGDVWLYATPILHASDAARAPSHRRVLQLDFSVRDLPAPLRWLDL